jgi:hypothetical protein
MSTTHNMKKMIAGALLSGGFALAALGLTAGTASAAPGDPGVTIDHSDFAGPVVECNQCGRTLPGDGSVRVNPGAQLGDGSVRVAIPSAGH